MNLISNPNQRSTVKYRINQVISVDQEHVSKISGLIDIQNELLVSTVSNPFLIKFPLSLNYVRNYLNQLIKLFEEFFEAEYISEEIYVLYVECMNNKTGRIQNTLYLEHANKDDLLHLLARHFDNNESIGFVMYMFDTFNLPIIERNNIVKSSTTGLRTWPASMHLYNFLKNFSKNKITDIKLNRANEWNKIIELGSGSGMLGLALIQSGFIPNGHYIFSDTSDEALKQIELSLFANQIFSNDKMKVILQKYDWQQYSYFDFTSSISDLIIASDIVFDTEIVDPLILTLKHMFKVYRGADPLKRYPDCLICCCIRNNVTINYFKEQLEKYGFKAQAIHSLSSPEWIDDFNNYLLSLSNHVVIEENFNQLLRSNMDNNPSIIFQINVIEN